MDTLPVELVALIFSFLKDWPFELRGILLVRLTCKLFRDASMLDVVYQGSNLLWSSDTLTNKMKDQPLYREMFFRQRLVSRYAKIVGACELRLRGFSESEIIEMYTHHLWMMETKEIAFIKNSFPVPIQDVRGEKAIKFTQIPNTISSTSLEMVKKMVTSHIKKGDWIRTRNHYLEGRREVSCIPDRFIYKRMFVKNRLLRTRKLFKFGLFQC